MKNGAKNPGDVDFPNLPGGPFVEAVGTGPATANCANYVSFSSLQGTGFKIEFINGGPDCNDHCSPSGLQIISNSNPVSNREKEENQVHSP